MTEVIELLSSSSPPRSPASLKAGPVSLVTKPATSTAFNFDLDDFDNTGSIDFIIDRPPKRPRLDSKPSSAPKADSSLKVVRDVDFDDSSDDDLLADLKRHTTTTFSQSPKKQSNEVEVIDEIIFSSSAPERLHTEKKKSKDAGIAGKSLLADLFDDDLDIAPIISSQPAHTDYDHKTANLLASLAPRRGDCTSARIHLSKSKPSEKIPKNKANATAADDIEFSSSPIKPRTKISSKLPEAEKAARAAERAAQRLSSKADKESAKEAEKARKQLEKEQKEKDKQKAADLAEVNKSRTNKKDATPEMILEMSSFLKYSSVGNQVEKRMDNVQVEVNYIDEEINLTDGVEQEQYGSIITWRRKVKSTYNDEDDQWEPTSRCRIVKEKHVLIHLPAGDFAAVAAVSRSGSGTSIVRTEQEMKANLDAYFLAIRRRFGDCIPVYLLEGLRSWLKKNENTKNRAYTAAVRAQMLQTNTESSVSEQRGRKRKKPPSELLDLSHITSDIIDDLLLHLQLTHQPVLIYHTPTPTDSASQISALTQHLATRPYRLAQLEYNLKSASFCMDVGQVRTGDNTKETFIKMLQEVQRVTPSMAYSIVEEFKTVRKLVKEFDKHGNLLLEDIRKAMNKNGGWSDKRLGPQVSKRLFKVFMGRDPTATDGMS